MRNISALGLAKLAEVEAVEPINFIAIDWYGTGHYTHYGDQENAQNGPILGRLLALGNLENVVNISGNTSSQSLSVKLDDTDGDLKSIINNNDINKKTVLVYQWFKYIPFSDAFIVFQGQIASPIEWNEGDRTLSFDVISKLEDKEVGFSAEEGDFAYIPPQLVGRAWPLIFGFVLKVPSVQINAVPTGALTDTTVIDQGTALSNVHGPIWKNNIEVYRTCLALAYAYYRYELQVAATASYYRFQQQIQVANAAAINGSIELGIQTPDFVIQDFTSTIQYLDNLQDSVHSKANDYIRQAAEIQTHMFELVDPGNIPPPGVAQNTVGVVNGQNFPQGTLMSLIVGSDGPNNPGATYTGLFTQENGIPTLQIIHKVAPFSEIGIISAGPLTVTDQPVATVYAHDIQFQSLYYSPGGSQVVIAPTGFYPIKYILCLNWCNVLQVWSRRTFNGFNILMPVPRTYYQVLFEDFGPIKATILQFPVPLSSRNEGWSDDIFCDLQSLVGPNVADIIIFLVETYTHFHCDPVSFAHFRTLQIPYPANFVLLDRPNIVELLSEIAFQCRSAIWFSNGVFYIKYLPEDQTPVETIEEDDIESGTLVITGTVTENVVTKLKATWKQNQEQDNTLIVFRHNIAKYGIQEEDYNFFIYNIQQLVEKSLQFWMIRKSNVWKLIKFSTFLTKLKIETYDTITLNLTPGLIANGPVNGVVQSVQYDSDNNRINLEVWLPIRFGEMVPYPFALPHDIDETIVFPTSHDSPGGGGVGSGASGTLINQSITAGATGARISTRPNSDQAGNYHDPIAQIPAINPSDRTDVTPQVNWTLDPNQVRTPTIIPGLNIKGKTNHKQWNVKKFAAPPIPVDEPMVFPGYVQAKIEGLRYTVAIYANGMDADPTNISVRCIGGREEDTITPGFPVAVMKNVFFKDGKQHIEYTMAVPIWSADLADYAQ